MRILHVNTSDSKGGAARAAYRLHKGLTDSGIKSSMLVQNKYTNDPDVATSCSNSKSGEVYSWLRSAANEWVQTLQDTTNPVLHSANYIPSGLHKQINSSEADIIHLHWLGNELISIGEIAKIQKPIIWTLHDMWAFTGAEHYDNLESPERYKEGYHKDNQPVEHTGLDIDRWTWNRKRKHWADVTFNIVTPCSWLAKCVKNSALFKEQDVKVIPNGINLDTYKPIPKDIARDILNIKNDLDTKFVLFGAMSATSDKRKGYKQLIKALSCLKSDSEETNYELIIFGSEGYDDIDFGLPTTFLGRLNDDETLALAYSAADVMVVPSLQDNLPNTAVEAIACGTPIVSFYIGGLPDIVNHKQNGYLAEAYNPSDLAEGIHWILEDEERQELLSKNARKKALRKFDIKNVSQQYINLYNNIVSTDTKY